MRPHLLDALRLTAAATARAATTLVSRCRDSLGTHMRTRGEWPFRGPADGPRSVFTISQRRKDER
jgi:hypothetical protein